MRAPLLASALVASAGSAAEIVDNTVVRRDTTGAPVDAHDGQLFRWPPPAAAGSDDGSADDKHTTAAAAAAARWYWLGTAYGNCTTSEATECDFSQNLTSCGWRDHDFSLYSSATLAGPWHLERQSLLPPRGQRRRGVYFRPKLIAPSVRRPGPRQWVLWYNYIPAGGAGHGNSLGILSSAVAGSLTGAAAGHFATASWNVSMGHDPAGQPQHGHGDFAVFVDETSPTAECYLAYGSEFDVAVDRLSADGTTSSKVTSPIIPGTNVTRHGVEAPVMLQREAIPGGSTEYVLIVAHTCWCVDLPSQAAAACVHASGMPRCRLTLAVQCAVCGLSQLLSRRK